MFGNFQFGQGQFGQPDFQPTGGSATATFTGFRLTITQRNPAVIVASGAGGGSGLPRRFVPSREASREAIATFKGHTLSIRLGQVSVSAGSNATASGMRIVARRGRVKVICGACARFSGEIMLTSQRQPMVSAGASVNVMGALKGSREEEELLLILGLIAGAD